MSKSTDRYGKITLHAHSSHDWPAQPTRKMLANWKQMDVLATKEFGKPYDALTGQQKTTLHLNIKTGKYDAKEEANVQTSKA